MVETWASTVLHCVVQQGAHGPNVGQHRPALHDVSPSSLYSEGHSLNIPVNQTFVRCLLSERAVCVRLATGRMKRDTQTVLSQFACGAREAILDPLDDASADGMGILAMNGV